MAEQNNSSSGTKEQWGTRIGVILAVAGSAVGLGNFLRFPGQAAQNGGGAFMLPYFVSLLILGIPLCWAEWTMGRYGGTRGFNSSPGIYSVIWKNRLAKYFGALALLIPLVIYMYYVLIEAWCLGYAYDYLVGNLPLRGGATAADYEAYYSNFIGFNANGFIYAGGNNRLVGILTFTFLLNFYLIYRGISKGIEKFCNVAMPLMAICALFVLVRVLTLGTPDPARPELNVTNGLGAMWNPNPEFLWRPETWLAAAGQIFFSLSIGFGIIINYSSYLRRQDDIALGGLTAGSVNEFFEVCFGGMITLPAAFIFLGATAVTMGTFGLGFQALPHVFEVMPGGRFFGFVWFFMLFLAAITSSLSMLQPVIAFFEEGLGLRRNASVAFLGMIAALGTGFCVYFSKGSVALDTFDFWVGTFLIFMLAMFQTIIYGWVLGIRRGEEELQHGAQLQVPRFVQYVLKFISPAYLLVIFVLFCWQALPSSSTPIFETNAAFADGLRASLLDPTLIGEMEAKGHPAKPSWGVVQAEDAMSWKIFNDDEVPVYMARLVSRDGTDALEVSSYKVGHFESIRRNDVVMASIFFIFVIFAFLIMLVRIASRRWEREGRLKIA